MTPHNAPQVDERLAATPAARSLRSAQQARPDGDREVLELVAWEDFDPGLRGHGSGKVS